MAEEKSWDPVGLVVSRYVAQIIEARAAQAGLSIADYVWQMVLSEKIRDEVLREVAFKAKTRATDRARQYGPANVVLAIEDESDMRELAEDDSPDEDGGKPSS